MAYTKVGWKNGASGGTPINAANLEHMDAQILQNTNDIATLNSNIQLKVASEYFEQATFFKNGNHVFGRVIFFLNKLPSNIDNFSIGLPKSTVAAYFTIFDYTSGTPANASVWLGSDGMLSFYGKSNLNTSYKYSFFINYICQ